MKLKTDGEREMLRIVSFLQEKLKDRMSNHRRIFAVSFLVPPPDLDPADGQIKVAAGGLRRGGRRKTTRSFTLD
ncbi:hypothetical protein [Holdemania filiformis]|uniref:hypothetical protein n=1 Tax=Holdemania filiformis TaxID=61171 RepID=UPI00242BE025|nr:hypothetical protein [Holdemania filiformis]